KAVQRSFFPALPGIDACLPLGYSASSRRRMARRRNHSLERRVAGCADLSLPIGALGLRAPDGCSCCSLLVCLPNDALSLGGLFRVPVPRTGCRCLLLCADGSLVCCRPTGGRSGRM